MIDPASPRYRMSFGTGGVHLNESVDLAAAYAAGTPWEALIAGESSFAARKEASARRLVRELTHRLQRLDARELELLLTGDRADRAALLWLAICRTYRFIGEWAQEVLGERVRGLRLEIDYDAFDRFFYERELAAPELARLTSSTRAKLRAVLFRLMRETDIIDGDGRIAARPLPPRVDALLPADERRFFPGAVR